MKRRHFLQQSTVLGAGLALGLPNLAFAHTPKYKIGLQLFTVRDAMAKDPLGTLKRLKAMGYQDFETYGFDPKTETIYGYSLSEFKTVLDDLGLTTTSGHYGFSDYFNATEDELRWFVDQCIKAAKTLESPYITWPWIHPDHRNAEDFQRLAVLLDRIGEQITAAGLNFAYHNHGYEFEDWGGTTGFDIILKHTNPDWVKLQMDMYWAVHSGITPKEMVAQQPGRYVMWHIKDMHKTSRDYTELGNGSIDYVTMLPNPETSGLKYYYIEQGGNFAVNSMESVATSIAYFKAHLAHLL